MIRRTPALGLAAAALVPFLARPSAAQRVPQPLVEPRPARGLPALDVVPGPRTRLERSADSVRDENEAARTRRAPLWAPATSLALPGTGQMAMRQARGAAYVAVEVYEWIQYAAARRERQRSSGEFRRLARDVARKAFGGTADGLWPYYEAMEEKSSSGRFYFSSDGALVPEMDTSTWNGSVWDKARQLFFVPGAPDPARTDPRYRSALAYYDSVAVHDGFLWDWSNNQLSWNLYKSAVARKNQETRLMNRAIAVIVVNHLVSGIDGLATVRLRRSTGARGEERYEVIVPWAPLGRPRSRGR